MLGITRVFSGSLTVDLTVLRASTAALEAFHLTELLAGLARLRFEVSNAFLWIQMFQPK